MKNGVFWVVTPCGSCKNPEDTILHVNHCFTLHLLKPSSAKFVTILSSDHRQKYIDIDLNVVFYLTNQAVGHEDLTGTWVHASTFT
jgi:hypothetical protein